MPYPRARTYVVESQAFFVAALTEVLERAGLLVERIAGTYDIEDVAAARPEVLFLDTDYLPEHPLDVVRSARSRLPESIICVYSGSTATGWAASCRRAGATATFTKMADSVELTDSLRFVLAARRR